MPRVAASDALYGKPAAADGTVLGDGFPGVLRAGRAIATRRWKKRCQHQLVTPDQRDKDPRHCATPVSTLRTSVRISTAGFRAHGARRRTTTSSPFKPPCMSRKTSRICRLQPLRSTDRGAVFLAITIPSRACVRPFGRAYASTCCARSTGAERRTRRYTAASPRRYSRGNRAGRVEFKQRGERGLCCGGR